MKFKLEFIFNISDSSLLIDANDGRPEEYTSFVYNVINNAGRTIS